MASQKKYNLYMRVFHWLMAALIITLLAVGYYMESLPSETPGKYDLYFWHKSFGVSILLLVLARLATRVNSVVPDLPNSFPNYVRFSSKAAHYLFYIYMFLIPIDGVLMSQFGGHKVPFFFTSLPTFVEKSVEHAKFFRAWHNYLVYSMLAVIILHISAVIKHRYIDKNDVLHRMT